MIAGVAVRALEHSDAAAALVLYNELTFGPPEVDVGGFFV